MVASIKKPCIRLFSKTGGILSEMGMLRHYDGKMRTVSTAAAIGLATGIFGGVFGYFLARLLLERGIVEGPPAGVLVFLLPPSLAAGCAFVGFVLALLRLWMAARKSTSLDE